ncbi:MAG: nicotinate phosphoribosyltransferase [Alphaproteobacteria bacterium]|jgi:nicotinate phosphoribosyltransferase|tara:strand:- start:6557 stop:7684 length:1128 start_codon:yes stop_codon:yes gene_type:complete
MDFKEDFEKINSQTDNYFLKTKKIISKFGDKQVTYAIFLRRPGILAIKMAVDWIKFVASKRKIKIILKSPYKEGDWFGAGEPILYITGSMKNLVDLETLYLQKIGPSCIAAANAYQMCIDLPKSSFIAMEARHCAGTDMSNMMSYAASVGSKSAKKKKAKGFIGTSVSETSKYFNLNSGLGTMPHALVGYAGSTMEAVRMFHATFPKENIVILPDYFGKEISDSIAVCKEYGQLVKKNKVLVRLDTPSGRYIEGLDLAKSYNILEKFSPQSISEYRSEEELKHLVGPGVSAAAIWYLRSKLNDEGFNKVKIIASSGFTNNKCKAMALAISPIDVVGTGSFLPEKWSETYATADIIKYGNEKRVKVSREYLLKKLK